MSEQQNRPILGIALMCLAVLFFGLLEMTAKSASDYMPPAQTVWARFVIHTVVMAVVFGCIYGRRLVATKRPKLQILRSLVLAATTLCQFTGLKYLQLAEVTTINFLAPFLVAILAIPLLGERPGPHRWGAIVVGFAGVLLVIRPGFAEVHWAVFIILIGAFGMALFLALTRMVSAVDPAMTSLFYSALVGAVAMSAIVPWFWVTPTDPMALLHMAGVGAFGATGHLILIFATRYAAGSALAPFMYTQIVWAVLFGYIAFGDLPDGFTWIGAAVVIASGVYLMIREAQAKRREAAQARAAGDVPPVPG